MNEIIIQWLYVFAAAYLLGTVYTLYIRRASHAKTWKGAIHAANYGSVLYILGAVVIISYTGNPWLLIPATVGDWLGTFTQIMYDIWKERGFPYLINIKNGKIKWQKRKSFIEERK